MGIKMGVMENPEQSHPSKITMEPSNDDMDPNGFYLSNKYIPEEILSTILSHVPAKDLLRCSLVCKNWNKLIKNNRLWIEIYKREYKNKKPKLVPWYVYYVLFSSDFFDHNLIRNGNGQDNYKYWTFNKNFGDGFIIEDPPCGCMPLPLDEEDFNKSTSCFATSYSECSKQQVIDLDKKIYKKIFAKFQPHIHVSEWICGRFDCGCIYTMKVKFVRKNQANAIKEYKIRDRMDQWTSRPWKKVEVKLSDYNCDFDKIIFEHEGKDQLYWKGHYGSKMAGAVVKILFDSITS